MRSVLLAIAVGVTLTTWPLVLHPLSAGMGMSGLEGPDHLWALWAGMMDGPVVIDTTLINFPVGIRWVLADPLNLVWFVPGWLLGGPGLGWNLVVAGSLAIAGLAAALWCRRLSDDPIAPPIAALLAVTAAPIAGSLLTGMSEALTMGWLALALLAVHRLADDRRWSAALLAGGLLGLTAWAGPYTAIYTALAAPPIVIAVLWQGGRAAALRLGLAGLIGGLFSLPVLRAVLYDRPAGLPGSDSGLPAVLADPGAAKNLMLGADPLGLIWPAVPIEPLHAVFLGTLLLPLALSGWRRAPALLTAAGILLVLGLGFFLQRDGGLWGARPLALPATWLSLKVDLLGRAIRWHRTIIAATILLCAPAAIILSALSSRLGRWRSVGAWLLAGAMVAEALLRAPLPWPRATFPIDPPPAYAQLAEGPILQLPLAQFTTGGPDQLRSASLLWQTSHGHPLGGNPRQPGASGRDPAVTAAAARVLDGQAGARQAVAALGFAWIVVHDERDAGRLTATLGAPDVSAEGMWAWSAR